METADQFKGMPMESLIGGPLKAACEANTLMAKATADFINEVGFLPEKDKDGNLVRGAPRMADFSFERPGTDENGNPAIDLVKVKVPLLAVVPIPNLQVNTIDIAFDMEVKSASTVAEKSSKTGSLKADAKFGFGPVSGTVNIAGSVAASSENTRSSDNSAKYHVSITAKNHGVPEGLARVLDMMNQAAAPRRVEQYKPNASGEINKDDNGKITDTPKLLGPDGNPTTTNKTTPPPPPPIPPKPSQEQ